MSVSEKPTKSKKSSRIVGLIMLGIGLLFMAIGGTISYYTYDFLENAEATTGQVLWVTSDYSDGSTTYQPTFGFLGTQGEKLQGTTFLSSSGYDFSVGAKMDILYDRRDPSSVRLTGLFNTWGFGLIFIASGIIPFLIGLFLRKIAKQPTVARRQPQADSRPEKYVTLESPESEENHRRETEYEPTVRRR